MVRYRFAAADLLRTRFAIAPLMELVAATYVLREPARYHVHRPWAEWAGPRAARLELGLLLAAAPFGTPFWPVFIGPPPREPHATIDAELARVAATGPERVAAEVARTYPAGVPTEARPLVDHPERALAALVAQMRAFWDATLAPWWARISAALEGEIAARVRALVAHGPQAAFAGLPPTGASGGETLS